MKQVFYQKGKGVYVLDMPTPVCSPKGVVVGFRYSLISSGTEIREIERGVVKTVQERPDLVRKLFETARKQGVANTVNMVRNKLEQLVALGYSAAGVALEVGSDVHDVCAGDAVACVGVGYANHAEYGYVPRNLMVKVPAGVDHEEAAFVALGAISLQGVRRAKLEIGETAYIVGLGLIGQLTVQLLRADGVRTIGSDIVGERVDLAKTLGMDDGFVAGSTDALKAVADFTSGRGVDAVVVCASSKNESLLNATLPLVRDKGRLVIIGDVPLSVERDIFYAKEMELVISRSYGPGRYDDNYEEKSIDYPYGYVRWTENRNMQEFLALIADRKINVKALVAGSFPVEEAKRAYQALQAHKSAQAAVLLRYSDGVPAVPATKLVLLKPADIRKQNIQLSIAGTGDIVRNVHLPNLRRLKSTEIRGIMSVSGKNDPRLAQRYGVKFITSEFSELAQDPETDALIIASRHNLHASMTLEAIRHGKHMFVEKPLAMSLEECEQIQEALAQRPVKLMVGFNRRFSPLTSQVKDRLAKTPGPIVIIARINAKMLPQNYWANSIGEGGGMILSEGCHFFDLFYYLTASEPRFLSAISYSSGNSGVAPYSNFSIQLRFENGSIGTLVYETIGNALLPKERIEIFASGQAMVIDDFRELVAYEKKVYRKKYWNPEKGHFDEMKAFLKYLSSDQADVPGLADGLRATRCALAGMDSIRSGKSITL